MIDIGGDDGAAARDFAPHELRRHERGQARTEAHPVAEPGFRRLGLPRAADILAMRDIDHLLADDPCPRQLELSD
jgi:hypothetical protein